MSRTLVPLLDRLLPRVDRGDFPADCWLWTGAISAAGYGVLGAGRRGEGTVLVHRAVYEHYVGAVPAEHDLDHVCRVTACCNPWHLEPVTRSENAKRQARSVRIAALMAGAA